MFNNLEKPLFLFTFVSYLVSVSSLTNPSIVITEDPCLPNQIHLSLGDAYYNAGLSNSTIVNQNSNASAYVVWQTKELCDDTYLFLSSPSNYSVNISSSDIWYELVNLTIDALHNDGEGFSSLFSFTLKLDGEGRYMSYSHTAILKDLVPGINYTYQILQTDGRSSAGPFRFQLPDPSPKDTSIQMVIYADIDTLFNNATINSLNTIVQQNPSAFDLQLFLGDLGYQIYSENGKRGEYFFNTAQPFLSTWPFMVTPGNHEVYQNFTFLNFRTRMPLYNQTQNHYYSYNVGKIHFVSINYLFYDNNPELRDQMYQWIENDLSYANVNRDERPWIIVYAHQPLYCSYSSLLDIERKRCYFFYGKNQIWEDLYHTYKVDLVLQGHVHYWERTGPVYRNQSVKYASWSEEKSLNYLINPGATIYTIEGSAGNSHFMINEPSPLAEYSINYDLSLGYSTLKMINESALYYEHINSLDGSVIDYFYLLKGPEYPTYMEYEPAKTISDLKVWIVAIILIALALTGLLFVCHRIRKRPSDDTYKVMTTTKKEKETEILPF